MSNNISFSQDEKENSLYDVFDPNENFANDSINQTIINEPEKDEFIQSIQKFFKYYYIRFNILLEQKDKIQFPNLQKNNLESHIKFLKEINELYNKCGVNNFDPKNIDEKLLKVLLDIIFNSDINVHAILDMKYNNIFEDEKYTPYAKEKSNKLIKSKNRKIPIDYISLQLKLNSRIKPLIDKLIKVKDFLLKQCKFSSKDFDSRGDFIIPNLNLKTKRGNEEYYPPYMWLGIGLNVSGKYEQDGQWLMKHDKDSKWTNAYLGFNQEKNNDIKEILHDLSFNNEKLEKYENEVDFKDERHWKQRIKKGIYLNNKIENAEKNSGIINIDNKEFKVLFMVKVKIDEICQKKNDDTWVLDKQYIRIYRILYKEINH